MVGSIDKEQGMGQGREQDREQDREQERMQGGEQGRREEWNQEFGYSAGNAPVMVTNEMLQCRDCRFRGKKVGGCEKFQFKPADVLAGRGECPAYEREGTESPDDGERGRYTSDSPDCEGCVFNFGNLNCAVYDIKPASIVIDHKPCEKREPGGAV